MYQVPHLNFNHKFFILHTTFILTNFRNTRSRKYEDNINCTLHLFKDQSEDGPTIGPKHVAGFII